MIGTALLCMITFGFECPAVDDNRHSPMQVLAPPPIEEPVGAVPEPGAAILFGSGLAVVAWRTRKNS